MSARLGRWRQVQVEWHKEADWDWDPLGWGSYRAVHHGFGGATNSNPSNSQQIRLLLVPCFLIYQNVLRQYLSPPQVDVERIKTLLWTWWYFRLPEEHIGAQELTPTAWDQSIAVQWLDHSMDWFEGKIAGNHGFSHDKLGFSCKFSLKPFHWFINLHINISSQWFVKHVYLSTRFFMLCHCLYF